MKSRPFVSVIIPAHNSTRHIERCVTSALASSYSSYEVIVVDDSSRDNTAEIAGKHGVTVLKLPHQSGPSAARNHAASKAKGDILFFIDSDIQIYSETVAHVADVLEKNPDISAVFGSYDDSPSERNFISQYKNLYHHFVHQHSSSEAMTFWAGCGAIRKEVFEEMGGFDHARFSRPSIEDIEMGFRMKKKGHRIFLDKDLQVKHLKEWRLKSFLHAEIFHRAVPWSNLILESGEMINDLNLKISQRVSAGLAGLSVLLLPLVIFNPVLIYGILFFLSGILILNYQLYSFFLNRRGITFTVLSFLMQILYYLYSSVTFAVCWGRHKLLKEKA